MPRLGHNYDEFGLGYAERRRQDPRIAAVLWGKLEECGSVLNIGAGVGSYEPKDRTVVAAEPSTSMLRQRPRGSAPVVQAKAEDLPFAEETFDAALGVLTLHHWDDWAAGIREVARVVRRRIVLLTWAPLTNKFWLTQRYFPAVFDQDARNFPTVDGLASILGAVAVDPLPIPWDCTDGFLGAYWRRPEMYLNPKIRSGISAFRRVENVPSGVSQLREDLLSGAWERDFGRLRRLTELDVGYKIVTWDKP